jgi:HSP20 family molecular chaperone IbpA
MSRMPLLSSPFLLGFEEIERALERVVKSADGYPPYNIERRPCTNGQAERLRITLAVAGFSPEELEVIVDDKELVIRGRQDDQPGRDFLHRGIAARQFQRTFVLADGMEVIGADLNDGLLSVELERPETARTPRRINISTGALK